MLSGLSVAFDGFSTVRRGLPWSTRRGYLNIGIMAIEGSYITSERSVCGIIPYSYSSLAN